MKETVIFLLIILCSTLSYAEVSQRSLSGNSYRTLSQSISQDNSNNENEKKLSTDVNVDTYYEIMNFKQGLIDSINMDVKIDDRSEDATVGAKIKF